MVFVMFGSLVLPQYGMIAKRSLEVLPRTGGLMTLDVLSRCRLLLTSRRGDRFELIWTLQGSSDMLIGILCAFFSHHFF